MNMKTMIDMVREFHEIFDPTSIQSSPTLNTKAVQKLRIALIREEFEELKDAIKDKDIVEVADALVDILYVTFGASLAFGIDIDKCFNEVHRSNMTKLGPDGNAVLNGVNCPLKPDKPYGKILKGENYSPPDLAKIINSG